MPWERGRCIVVLTTAVVLTWAGCGGGGGSDSSGPPMSGGRGSVCGGLVSSVPKLCNLEPRDAGVIDGIRYMSFRYCVSDAEGDIDTVCVAVSVGGVVDSDCATAPPRGSRINQCLETDPIAIAPTGVVAVWTVAFNVADQQGNISNVVSTDFSCCR